LTWALASMVAASAQDGTGQPDSLVLIVADDLGIDRVGCYGDEHARTPNIDRLSKTQGTVRPTRRLQSARRRPDRGWGQFASGASLSLHHAPAPLLPAAFAHRARQGRAWAARSLQRRHNPFRLRSPGLHRASCRGILFETTHRVVSIPLRGTEAYLPPPRMHQLTYHGVLSSAASRRSEIVPGSQPPTAPESAGPSSSPPRPPRPCNRYSWPELMARVFAVDVLRCGKCRSRLRWIAAITEASVIARILAHLGQESTAPVPMPARPPPQPQLPYW